jgi:SAM-dependent methyltransferase
MDPYEAIANAYDGWAQVADDVPFYVEQASAVDLLVELGIGTGRVGVPMAHTGAYVIGIDASDRMLELCRRRAEAEGVAERVDLRLGDFCNPPVSEQVPLVVSPFRSLSHLGTEEQRDRALAEVWTMLAPGGRLVFDVATPEPEQVLGAGNFPAAPSTSGVSEQAEWDWERRELRLTLTQFEDGRETVSRLRLSWLTREDWRRVLERAGFEIQACYGWFDQRPATPGGYSVWVARRPED